METTEIIKPIYYNFDLIESGKLKNKTQYSIFSYPIKESLFLLSANCGSKDEIFVKNWPLKGEIFIKNKNKNEAKKPEYKIISGIAHLIEHILYTFNKSEDNLPFNITRYNGIYNAMTGYRLTSYFFYVDNSKFLFNLDIFMNIFKSLNEHLTDKTIESEIISIQHEKNKNYQSDINNICEILRQESDNELINHDPTGTIKSLKIDNILYYVKLFYRTFYKPENLRISIITNNKLMNIEEIKERLNKFSDFYTDEYVDLLTKPDINLNYSINPKFNLSFLDNRIKILKNNNLIKYQTRHIEEKTNKIYIFLCLPFSNNKYDLFLKWVFNRKDNRGLYELLKNKFNIFNYYFISFDNYVNSQTYFFTFEVYKDNTKDVDLIYSYIQFYFNQLQNLTNNEILSIINYFEIYEDLLKSYTQDFKIANLLDVVNIMFSNLNLEFNCQNELLNNYKKSEFEVEEIKQVFNLFDLNNFSIIQSFYNHLFKPNKNLTINPNIKYELLSFKINKKINNQSHIQLLPNDAKQIKELTLILEKDKKECLKINENIKAGEFKIFTHQKFKNIDFYYKTVDFTCFNISCLLSIELYYGSKSDYNFKLVYDLLLIEDLKNKLDKKYSFLIPTNLIFNYTINKSRLLIYFECLNNYFLTLLFDILEKLNELTHKTDNQIDKSKTLLLGVKSLIKEKLNNNSFNSLTHEQYFYKSNFDYYKIIDIIDDVNNYDKMNKLDISNIEIFTYFNQKCNLDNQEFKTLLYQYLGLFEFNLKKDIENQTNILSVIPIVNQFIEQPETKINFDVIQNYDKKIIGIYDFKNKKMIELFNFERVEDFKTFDLLKQPKPDINLNSIETQNINVVLNIELFSPFVINKRNKDYDVIKNIRELFYLYIIKNIIFNNFFKIFRTQKGYTYIIKSNRCDYGLFPLFKRSLSFIIVIEKKEKYTIDFIFKYYDEVKSFLIDNIKTIDIINIELQKQIFKKKILTKLNNSAEQLEKDYTFIKIFGKDFNLNEIIKFIDDITLENIKNYYLDLVINSPMSLFIY